MIFEVWITSDQGALSKVRDVEITVRNECYMLSDLYNLYGNTAIQANGQLLWLWDPAQMALIQAGYQVRDPTVSIELPIIDPTLPSMLPSGLDIYTNCGPIEYNVTYSAPAVFTPPDYDVKYDLPANVPDPPDEWYWYTDPSDNTVAQQIEIYTKNEAHASFDAATNYRNEYELKVYARLADHPTAVLWEYWLNGEITR